MAGNGARHGRLDIRLNWFGRDFVVEAVWVKTVESAGSGLGLRVHEEADWCPTGARQYHIMAEVECHPVHLPRAE